jgi:hypothetical protein
MRVLFRVDGILPHIAPRSSAPSTVLPFKPHSFGATDGRALIFGIATGSSLPSSQRLFRPTERQK